MVTITPINRYTEHVTKDDGTKAYKVYNMMSPHYYMDKTGSLNSIDITNLQTITKDTVGEIKLREKNVVSAGFRTDGNKTKYLGLRPDETQEDGTQQLEWTIEEAIINNVTQSITLNQTNAINNITTNLGGQVVQSTRNYTRQMVPVTGSISNFQVKYKLHLTGLQISNSKDNGTDYYTSDNGYFKITDADNNTKFQIPLPVLLDSNFEEVTNDTIHTLKDNGDGTYEYIKYPSDNLLSNGISSSVAYIDATTVYGDSLDGSVYRSLTSTSWSTTHDDDDGSAVVTSEFASPAVGVGNTGLFGSTYWKIHRTFLSFDTSAINGLPTATSLFVKTKIGTNSDMIGVEATYTAMNVNTFNDFTGWEAGWDGDAGDTEVVTYTNELSDIADDGEFNEMPFISAGLSAVQSNSTTKVCLMDYDYDYKDVQPGSGFGDQFFTGLYFSTGTDGSDDPYLLITGGIPGFTNFNIKSGKTKILGGKFIIK